MLTLLYGGETFTNFTEDDLLNAGVPQKNIDVAMAKQRAIGSRDAVRSIIAKNVGDTASLVGTIADGTGLLIALSLADIVALAAAPDFAKYKKAKLDTLKVLAGGADLAKIAGTALGKIKSGDVVLTASLKGVEAVITESLARSTGVATILVQAAKKK